MTSTPARPASRNPLLDTLGANFAVFRECRPLALGIHKAIIARMPELDAAQLRLALRMHTASTRYLKALQSAGERFDLDATGIKGIADRQELARKMFLDVEGLLLRKQKQWGIGSMLRFFREIYLREIDKQWMDHLQTMDHLRDGIGLRGYGQRDPKKEYKREGYDLFMAMMRSMKSELCLLYTSPSPRD